VPEIMTNARSGAVPSQPSDRSRLVEDEAKRIRQIIAAGARYDNPLMADLAAELAASTVSVGKAIAIIESFGHAGNAPGTWPAAMRAIGGSRPAGPGTPEQGWQAAIEKVTGKRKT